METLRIHEDAHEHDVFPVPKKYDSFARVILLRAVGEEPSLIDVVDERLRRAEESTRLFQTYLREAIAYLEVNGGNSND